MSDYDSEHYRFTKSVHHRLDLGPHMLLGAQQHTTVEAAAALKIQDKIEGKYMKICKVAIANIEMKCTKGQKI